MVQLSFVWKGVFLVWLIAIATLSLIPHPPVPKDGVLGWDKFQHAFAYGVLAVLGALSLPSQRLSWGSRLLFAAFLAIVVGGLMELAQAILTKTRSAELGDLVADAVGAALVACLARLLTACRSERKWSVVR